MVEVFGIVVDGWNEVTGIENLHTCVFEGAALEPTGSCPPNLCGLVKLAKIAKMGIERES
jgi:hypothetical protein